MKIQHISLVLIAFLFGCSREPNWNNDRITLEGAGSVEVLPDRASWEIEIHCVGASIESAAQQVREATVRLQERSKSLGLPAGALESSGVRQGTEWEWVDGRRKKQDQFFAEASINLTIDDMTLYPKISERLFLDDALIVSRVNFRHSKKDEAYKDALASALSDAEAKARFIAEKSGVKIRELESVEVISECYAAVPSALTVDAPSKVSAALPAVKTEVVSAAVRVTYKIAH